MSEPERINVQDLEHLGIIAGIIDSLGIVEIINESLGTDTREKVSAGQVVKAMIINCMGFLTAPLYLFSEFFVGKATEHLIGEGVKVEYLNDSRIGRVLEQLYEYGLTYLFIKISSAMVNKFGIKTKTAHLDGTSISVEGQYLSTNNQGTENSNINGENEEAQIEPVPIKITYGYSRDNRPDLKQFTLDLLTVEEGIPLLMQVNSGNQLDQNSLREILQEFREQWTLEQPEVYVMDAAFYTEENLTTFNNNIKWITRVPLTLKAAQELTKILLPEQFTLNELDKNYQFCEVCNQYADIKQRWIIIESQKSKEVELKTLSKRIEKSLTTNLKTLKSLENSEFACELDALKAAKEFEKTLKFHHFGELKIVAKPHYQRKGRPKSNDEISHYTYQIQANLIENEVVINNCRNQAGRFILATNILEDKSWTSEVVLQEYKEQQTTERGFRFLKDPLFFVSRVFLKNTKRIMALAMIMTLALMVYSLGQRQLRKALEVTKSTLPNQKGKPTERPTLRWIFQCLQSIHLIFVDGIKYCIKLTDRQRLILQFFSSHCQKYYFLS